MQTHVGTGPMLGLHQNCPESRLTRMQLPACLISSTNTQLQEVHAKLRVLIMSVQAGLRALAALAAASLVIRPDDPTYVGGLFMTLSSLLDKVDSMRSERGSFGHFLAQAAAGSRKKAVIADFRCDAVLRP